MSGQMWRMAYELPRKHFIHTGITLIVTGLLALILESVIIALSREDGLSEMNTFAGVFYGIEGLAFGIYSFYAIKKNNRTQIVFLLGCCKLGNISAIASASIANKALYSACTSLDSWNERPNCKPIAAMTVINTIFYAVGLMCYFSNLSLCIRLFCAPGPPPPEALKESRE